MAAGVALSRARGVFGFSAEDMRGTLTMTDGSSHGFVRMVVYVHRIGGQAMETPLRMETEAREAWIDEATADCVSHDTSVMALTMTLFDAAELPSQRAIRISVGNG